MDVIKSHYKVNTPIFRKEIISLFPQYSEIYVCKMIKKAVDNGELIHHSMGVYYIPTITKFGLSHITACDIMTKHYVCYEGKHYGIFSGLSLDNRFGLTTQTPATLEIVSNNESSKRRKVQLDGMKYIVSKSRTEITSKNYTTYIVLQLFTQLIEQEVNEEFLKRVNDYIKKNNITRESLISLSAYFPKKALARLSIYNII